jgi:hypothetical protein
MWWSCWVQLVALQDNEFAAGFLNKVLSAAVAASAAAAAEAGAADNAAAAAEGAAPNAQSRQMPAVLCRADYLRCVVPSRNPATATDLGGSSSVAAAAGDDIMVNGGAVNEILLPGQVNDAVTPEMAAAVQPAIKALALRHPVASMANVRQWLQQQQAADQVVRSAAMLSDTVLHGLLQVG